MSYSIALISKNIDTENLFIYENNLSSGKERPD